MILNKENMEKETNNGLKTALVVGATGVVGREITAKILEDKSYKKVIVWVRKELNFTHEKLKVRVINFDEIQSIACEKVDEIFCALGTTIKQAKSRQNFLKVDVEYVKQVAKWGKNAGARRFLLLSARGASENSLFFYNRAKAKAQNAVIEQGFEATQIFALPLIKGERADKRVGETFGIRLLELFSKSWFDMYPMSGKEIAECILRAAKNDVNGVKIYKITAKDV